MVENGLSESQVSRAMTYLITFSNFLLLCSILVYLWIKKSIIYVIVMINKLKIFEYRTLPWCLLPGVA